MKNLLLYILLVLSFTLYANDEGESQMTTKKKTILFLGDSLTAGYGVEKELAYPSLVEQKLKKKFNVKVLNGGVSGSTTASGISRLKWFLKADPDILVLILGANDGLRGIKVEESKKNLRLIIDKANKEGLKVILAGMMLPPNYGKEYTTNFKKMYEEIRDEYKLDWIPFILQDVAGLKDKNIEDGIHPNSEGHEIIASNLIKYLEPHL